MHSYFIRWDAAIEIRKIVGSLWTYLSSETKSCHTVLGTANAAERTSTHVYSSTSPATSCACGTIDRSPEQTQSRTGESRSTKSGLNSLNSRGKEASDKIAKATGSCAICSAASSGIGLIEPHHDFFLANSKMTSSSVQWYKDKKGRNKYWAIRQAFELFHAATVRKTAAHNIPQLSVYH
jgi:hypothetical protein